MSATATETVTIPQFGTFRFTDPDLSIGPEERGLFEVAVPKHVKLEHLELHDYRKAKHLKRGALGLSQHGFTLVNHTSALHGDTWFSEPTVESTYYSEVQSLVANLTGARKVLVTHVGFRRRPDSEALDSKKHMKRGEEDSERMLEPVTKPLLVGAKAGESLEPAHTIHCDLTNKGARSMIRHLRQDIADAAQAVIKAEDECAAAGRAYDGPRYACYSVWRPLKTVRRDPLALADSRTVSLDDFVPTDFRQPGKQGVFTTESYAVRPSETTRLQKWYWLPEQTAEEVLVIKLADSDMAREGMESARGTPHGSPKIEGTEEENARESIEARVIAIW